MNLSEFFMVLGSPIIDDFKFQLMGDKAILETWFQEDVPGLFSLDTE